MPRVAEPVWLTMRSVAPEKQLLCSHFMRELAFLVEQASKNQLSGLFTYNSVWTGEAHTHAQVHEHTRTQAHPHNRLSVARVRPQIYSHMHSIRIFNPPK